MDAQAAARSFTESSHAELERAQTCADYRRAVSPEALATPTQKPLDAFDGRTWPACYVEWWFGDGAPNLGFWIPLYMNICHDHYCHYHYYHYYQNHYDDKSQHVHVLMLYVCDTKEMSSEGEREIAAF